MEREYLHPTRKACLIHVLILSDQFNTPVQLGPTSSTKPHDARVFTIPVQQDDILILASDGLSDNLWDKDILDEVVRFPRSFTGPSVTIEEADGKDASPASGTACGGVPSQACLARRFVRARA